MEKTSVTLPDDLIIQILLRMPLKSLVKCTCASKYLATIIRSKEFIDGYLVRSMKRPRLLFIDQIYNDVLFHSVYQEDKPLLSSGHQQVRIRLDSLLCNNSHSVRGLICLQEKTKVMICNLGAKKFHILPKIVQGEVIKSFFGYDGDVFKVLCVMNESNHVFTVGSGEESWRPISCEHHHYPVTQGLCKEGVLYYGALSHVEKYIVMSFNVKSEKFTVIELPEGVKFYYEPRCSLVNYNGKIALVDHFDFAIGTLTGKGEFGMWVRDEGEGTWSNKVIEIPRWKETVGDMDLYFKGTIGTGELVFAPHTSCHRGSFFVLYYDTVEGKLKKTKIEGMDFKGRKCQMVETLLDHVDSPWLI